MPNGGSDHCGNCRHNRVNIGRESTREERGAPAFCTVRNVEIRATHSTYCANHYTRLKVPLGPIYAEHGDRERIPYHGGVRPRPAQVSRCHLCGNASRASDGVELPDAAGTLHFCGAAHYARWWKQSNPGQRLRWDPDAPPPTSEQRGRRIMDSVVELARAFIAAGDPEGARETLDEAERNTGVALSEEARALRASLGP